MSEPRIVIRGKGGTGGIVDGISDLCVNHCALIIKSYHRSFWTGKETYELEMIHGNHLRYPGEKPL